MSEEKKPMWNHIAFAVEKVNLNNREPAAREAVVIPALSINEGMRLFAAYKVSQYEQGITVTCLDWQPVFSEKDGIYWFTNWLYARMRRGEI